MFRFLSVFIVISLILSSCTAPTEPVPHMYFETYSPRAGTLALEENIISSVEGSTTSDLAFRQGGRITHISVRPGDHVNGGQVIARVSSQETYIQKNSLQKIAKEIEKIGISTDTIQGGTVAMQSAVSKLYDARIASIDTNRESLQNSLEKAKQNLKNQLSTLPVDFLVQARDYERLTTTLLYEGDKILGMTTNFEFSNDGWEPYLGVRIGNIKSETELRWNTLYKSLGIIRAYTQTGAKIADINYAISDLRDAYRDAHLYTTSMNTMLQNSIIGAGLTEEKLTTWTTLWNGYTADEQQSESRFVTWNNTILNLLNPQTASGSVSEKDIRTIELELKNLTSSRDTLIAEKSSKLKEIQVSVDTIDTKKGELAIQREQNLMNDQLADESLESMTIRASFDGVILEKYADIGNVVGSGIPVLRMASSERYILKAYIDNDAYRYKVRDRIVLENTSLQTTLTGTITLIQKEKDPLHNKNAIEIQLPDNSLPIGERVSIRLSRTKTPLQDGVIIPLESIITRYGPAGVFLIQDGRAVFTLVQVVSADLKYAEVIGIPPDAVVITKGKENIIDGQVLSGSDSPQEGSH